MELGLDGKEIGLQRCQKCKEVSYCSRDHQVRLMISYIYVFCLMYAYQALDWRVHKRVGEASS